MPLKLTDLEPRFVVYETVDAREHTRFARPDSDGVLHPIPFIESQGIEFLCPICFVKNNGALGTHLCSVTFAGRGATDTQGSHNEEGKAVRWNVSGDSFENLTTTPSILLIGGCGWHGFITNGVMK